LEAACLNTDAKGSISETSYEIVRLLLEYGANPNLYGARDSLLYQLAGRVAAGNDSDYLENIIFLLLDYEAELVSGGTLEKYDHDMLLTFAVQGNNLGFLEALYNNQCYDINHAGNNGVTPLIRAVLPMQDAPNSQIIRFLVENGANPNIADETGNSAYDYARQLDYTEVILILDEATS